MTQSAPLPRLAWPLGLGGLLPFLATAGIAVAGPTDWQPAALKALAAYGAVILAFLGAVHWGFALPLAGPPPPGPTPRLVLGVLPALVGWLALLLPTAPGLWLLAAGVLATLTAEAWAARRGHIGIGYFRLRVVLSAGAAAALALGALSNNL